MAVDAKMTASGTSTARSGSSFAAVLGNLAAFLVLVEGVLKSFFSSLYRVLGNWMTAKCRKTCGECKCKCCSYQVSWSNFITKTKNHLFHSLRASNTN